MGEKEKTLPYGKMVPNQGKGNDDIGKPPYVNYHSNNHFRQELSMSSNTRR